MPPKLPKSMQGYSPCPTSLLEIIVSLINPAPFGGHLLDNCAGTGHSADFLSQKLNLSPVLAEPHPGRHQDCLMIDETAALASAQCLLLVGQASIWFFNPPFEKGDSSCEMPKEILYSSLNYAVSDGTLCIWLLPAALLVDVNFSRILSASFEAPFIRLFPADLFDDYQQMVIIGHWEKNRQAGSTRKISVSDIPFIKPDEAMFSIDPNSLVNCILKRL